jgi:ethanolamine utilization cobalamin adenosyltransferase
MKFLTEYDLRQKYQEKAFDEFLVRKEIRLTPEARQFLIDRKVKIIDERFQKNVLKPNNKDPIISEQEGSLTALDCFRLRCEILGSASKLEKFDLLLAQELYALEKSVACFAQGSEFLLPTIIQTDEVIEIDEKWLEDRLSLVSMFIQSSKGAILTQLYALYFELKKIELSLFAENKENFQKICDFVGQLIAYYIKGGPDEGKKL